MKNKKKLELGDVVIINSPSRLKDIHGKKGYISAHSYDGDKVTAYTVTINMECWFVLLDEIEKTNEKTDPNLNMTDDFIKIFVDKNNSENN
jgi:hypothetical protein